MPRLLKIMGAIIAAAAVVKIIPSNSTESREPPELVKWKASIAKLCTSLKLESANHITRSPRMVAVIIPRPWEVYEPYDQTARVCTPPETAITLPQGMLALFESQDYYVSCTTTSEKPASVSAALTASYVPEAPTAASTFPQNTSV